MLRTLALGPPAARQLPPNALVIGRGLLIRDPVDRAFVSARGGAGHRLDHFARAFRIGDPLRIEIEGAGCDAARAFAGIEYAGIRAMAHFIAVGLTLDFGAEIPRHG